MSRRFWFALFIAVVCVNSAIVFPLSLGATVGSCCNGVNTQMNNGCSGCVPFGVDFISVGMNPVYYCTDYSYGPTCDDQHSQVCWTSWVDVNTYSATDCETVNGFAVAPVKKSVKQCTYDPGCD